MTIADSLVYVFRQIDLRHGRWRFRRDELQEMLDRGYKTREIAAYYGVTKNAVIGAKFRLGLCARKPRRLSGVTLPKLKCLAVGD